jgi:protein ImuA
MAAAGLPETLNRLRQTVAETSPIWRKTEENQSIVLGIKEIDTALGGGLDRAALHELSPLAPLHRGAARGFAIALAIRAHGPAKSVLWLQTDFLRHESGGLYGPGVDLFGLPTDRLIILRTKRSADVFWAMEEALKCRAVGSVVAELSQDPDLTATRRLALAAREGGGNGFLLHLQNSFVPSATATRWEISSLPGIRDGFGGLGATAFTAALLKNRRGPCGRWNICWDHHARAFAPAAVSLGMAETARDRPDRARFLRAG